MRACLRILMLVCLGISSSYADRILTWNGGTGDWDTASNWTPPVVPNNSASNAYEVTIGSGATDIVSLDAALNPTITSLSLGASAGTSSLQGVFGGRTNSLTVEKGMTVNRTGTVNFGGPIGGGPPGESLTVKGTLTNDGSVNVYPGSLFAGNLLNAGHLALFAEPIAHTTFTVPGTLTNNGFVQLGAGFNGPSAPVTSIGKLVNNGSLSVAAGTVTLTNQPNGITDVRGTIDLGPGGYILSGSNSAFAHLTSIEGSLSFYVSNQSITVAPQNSSATLSIGARGNLSFTDGQNWTVASNLDNAGSIFFGADLRQQGPNVINVVRTLTNTGTITVNPNTLGFSQVNARTLENGGSISIPAPTGNTFPLLGGVTVGTGTPKPGYTQYSNGTLDELLFSPSRYGTISVGGPVSLDGTLDITPEDGFTPTPGESFTLLKFAPGELTGTFDRLLGDPYFKVNYDDAHGSVTITAEPVPEPATLLITGCVLLAFAGFRGYRRRSSTKHIDHEPGEQRNDVRVVRIHAINPVE